MAPAFAYEALQDPSREIRLLRIAPGDPLSCQLSVHRLEDAPEYRAISYAWGDASNTHAIQVDGQEFAVRENCSCALRQARQFFPEGTLIWLDAICINQNDNDEKGPQVAMMGRIFSDAKSVLISVGEHYDDSKFLLDTVAWFQSMFATSTGSCEHCDKMATTPSALNYLGWITASQRHAYHIYMEAVEVVEYARLYSAHWSYSHRPYWERMWIIQEAVHAREIDVACGECVIRLSELSFLQDFIDAASKDNACLFAGRLPVHPQPTSDPDLLHQQSLHSLIAKKESWATPQMLDDCLFHLASYKCYDFRDRIYGLLDIVKWGRKGPPPPDYDIDPFSLAVQVLKVAGDRNEKWRRFWPQYVSELLDVLGIFDLDAGCAPGSCSSAVTSIPPPSVGQGHCDCASPIAPEISLTDRLWCSRIVGFVIEPLRAAHECSGCDWRPGDWAETRRLMRNHGLKEGDVLVPIGPEAEKPSDLATFCLVLRKVHRDYYEILSEAPRVGRVRYEAKDWIVPHAGRQFELRLCLNAIDAAFLACSLHRLIARAGPEDPLDDTRYSLLHERHDRLRMSSYAIDCEDGRPPGQVMGARSADGTSIPCAQCGGLFEPTEEMHDEYVHSGKLWTPDTCSPQLSEILRQERCNLSPREMSLTDDDEEWDGGRLRSSFSDPPDSDTSWTE